jgi:hypothetical protein
MLFNGSPRRRVGAWIFQAMRASRTESAPPPRRRREAALKRRGPVAPLEKRSPAPTPTPAKPARVTASLPPRSLGSLAGLGQAEPPRFENTRLGLERRSRRPALPAGDERPPISLDPHRGERRGRAPPLLAAGHGDTHTCTMCAVPSIAGRILGPAHTSHNAQHVTTDNIAALHSTYTRDNGRPIELAVTTPDT